MAWIATPIFWSPAGFRVDDDLAGEPFAHFADRLDPFRVYGRFSCERNELVGGSTPCLPPVSPFQLVLIPDLGMRLPGQHKADEDATAVFEVHG